MTASEVTKCLGQGLEATPEPAVAANSLLFSVTLEPVAVTLEPAEAEDSLSAVTLELAEAANSLLQEWELQQAVVTQRGLAAAANSLLQEWELQQAVVTQRGLAATAADSLLQMEVREAATLKLQLL